MVSDASGSPLPVCLLQYNLKQLPQPSVESSPQIYPIFVLPVVCMTAMSLQVFLQSVLPLSSLHMETHQPMVFEYSDSWNISSFASGLLSRDHSTPKDHPCHVHHHLGTSTPGFSTILTLYQIFSHSQNTRS